VVKLLRLVQDDLVRREQNHRHRNDHQSTAEEEHTMADYRKKKQRWALAYRSGHTILPSFTPDGSLDRQASVMTCARSCAGVSLALLVSARLTTFEEDKRFVEWCTGNWQLR
jgi:hypothetical protein